MGHGWRGGGFGNAEIGALRNNLRLQQERFEDLEAQKAAVAAEREGWLRIQRQIMKSRAESAHTPPQVYAEATLAVWRDRGRV